LTESQFFKDDLQAKHYFDLKKDIDTGRIIRVSTPIKDIQKLIKKASENRLDIHRGEAASIAALQKPEYQQLYFCTADRVAVIATHLFDDMSRVVSFEKCLSKIKPCKLPYKLTKAAMQNWKAEAIQRIG
jgi:hypothetical protein